MLAGTESLNSPLASVEVPAFEPFPMTEAPATGPSLFIDYFSCNVFGLRP
jgi:hypothetical protein